MSAERIEIEAIGAEGAELARYRVSGGERVVMGWRRPGGVEVSDRPVEGRARGYLVDRGFRCAEQLAAFVGEYLAQARLLDACPMGGEQLEAMLAETDAAAAASLLGEAS
jgi:hypothetical protein